MGWKCEEVSSARPLCPQEMALVILIKPIIMLRALCVCGLVSRGVLTQRQPKPDPIFLPPGKMPWQVRWGKWGKVPAVAAGL